jgi:hypothetical protein
MKNCGGWLATKNRLIRVVLKARFGEFTLALVTFFCIAARHSIRIHEVYKYGDVL